MSLRDRFSTRDIAHAAAERREKLRDEDQRRDNAAAAAATAASAAAATTPPKPLDRVESATQNPPSVATATPVVTDNVERTADRVDRAVASAEHAIFPGEEAGGFRSRWEAIQTGFVDEPRAAVEQADALVAQVVTRLAEVFSEERTRLEQHWDRGDNISTEDLRIALKRYRSFFDRLLSV
jgi:hypothetical protein